MTIHRTLTAHNPHTFPRILEFSMTFRDPRSWGLAVVLKTVVSLALAGVFAAGVGRNAVAGPLFTVGEGVSISNIGALTDVTDSLTANVVGFSNVSNPNVQFAQGFTSTGTAGLEVTTIVLGLAADTPVSTAQVQLFSNTLVSGTNVPGSALATFTLTGTSSVQDTDTYGFSGSYTLDPSTRYWVVVSDAAAVSGSSSFSWIQAEVGESPVTPTGSWGYVYNNAARTRNGTTWTTLTSANPLSVQVVAVPEPESLALLGVGTATVANGLMRRRRRSKR